MPCRWQRMSWRKRFVATRPNETWVTDITYVPTAEGGLSFAGIKDLFTCAVVGHAMDARMTTDLVSGALRRPSPPKRPGPGLLHYADRGSPYCAQDYQTQLRQCGLVPSMSRRGNCYDNVPMESFWGTLKNELVHHRRYATQEQARKRSQSTLSSSITVSGGTPDWEISRRSRSPNRGPVNSRRHEAATDGVHY